MKLKIFFFIISYSILSTLSIYSQSNQVLINSCKFSFLTKKTDNYTEDKIIELYRGEKKLLSHTIYRNEGDCSATNLELGNYSINKDQIIFYSYWAVTDRMPTALIPYGYRKQVYAVNNEGRLILKKATIYIEDALETPPKNKKFVENNGWKHKGLKYLYAAPKNKIEQELLQHYIQSIEKEYNAEFVLGDKKEILQKEIRSKLKSEINTHTKDWVEGEIYGRVKK